MTKQTVRDIDVQGKRVLLRAALNVPIKNNVVSDAFRIESALPTIRYLLEQGAGIMLISHHSTEGVSLEPVVSVLQKLLDHGVKFISDVTSAEAQAAAQNLLPGQILLFENLRFHPEEEANDKDFAKQLAQLADVYVDDDFTVMHRKHASVVGVPKHLPAVAGLLVEREVDYIAGSLEHPDRPLVAVLGGAKMSTKIELLRNLVGKVDVLMLTGPIANTFALAQGKKVGRSLTEPNMLKDVREIVAMAKRENTELFLPEEVVVSQSLTMPSKVRATTWAGITPSDYVVDATSAYAELLKTTIYDFLDFNGSCTILWNGPLGITEIPEFTEGSRAMAGAIIATKGTSIVGGGDTAAFVDAAGLHDNFTWVSTGGGASLELMGGKPLPGLEALLDKAQA
jgi:3-phosphoglycerate kinase